MLNAGGFFYGKPAAILAGFMIWVIPMATAAESPDAKANPGDSQVQIAPAESDTPTKTATAPRPAFVIDWGTPDGDGDSQIIEAWQPTKPTKPVEPAQDSAGLGSGQAGASSTGPIDFTSLFRPVAADVSQLRPKILSAEDIALYKKIFRLQAARKWRRADKLIKDISDPALLGHVLYQRYLHPTHYRAKYKELLDWMQKYRDHPGANRIYKLAIKRRPKNWRYPQRPIEAPQTKYGDESRRSESGKKAFYRLSRSKRRYIRRTQRHIRIYVRRAQPTRAYRLLTSKKSKRVFDPVSMDESRVEVARGFFNAGKDVKTLELAGEAAKKSGDTLPLAHWWAGLAAWRLGMHERASDHFTAMTKAQVRSDWSKAAAAFWAARAHLVNRRPEQVNLYLTEAAQYPNTFYGLLSIRTLGLEPSYNWNLPRVEQDAWKELTDTSHGRRALALLEVGETARAEKELKRRTANMSEEDAHLLVALSTNHNMPSLALRIGRLLRQRHGAQVHAALYPLPEWEPRNGFTIDKALVFAVMRQESRFLTRAKSHAGARGLMQLMPRTASFISGRRYRGNRRQQLFEPELNMALGQKYVQHLLRDPNIDGDLFYAVAAYNGGPGNLRKWRRRTDYKNDPLLFIESIPLRETRIYVERVLTNLWIYRYRFGQPAPSLDAIAAGEWPSYTPLDGHGTNLAATDSRGL
jgi:soluble lytic murein transglycosylase-like protein